MNINAPLERLNVIINGKIPNEFIRKLCSYAISEQESELLLEKCDWNYSNNDVKESEYNSLIRKNFSSSQLYSTVEKYCEENKEFNYLLDQVNRCYQNIRTNDLTEDEKKACSLSLLYYTKSKANSNKINININSIIRGQNSFTKEISPIINYLHKAI